MLYISRFETFAMGQWQTWGENVLFSVISSLGHFTYKTKIACIFKQLKLNNGLSQLKCMV